MRTFKGPDKKHPRTSHFDDLPPHAVTALNVRNAAGISHLVYASVSAHPEGQGIYGRKLKFVAQPPFRQRFKQVPAPIDTRVSPNGPTQICAGRLSVRTFVAWSESTEPRIDADQK